MSGKDTTPDETGPVSQTVQQPEPQSGTSAPVPAPRQEPPPPTAPQGKHRSRSEPALEPMPEAPEPARKSREKPAKRPLLRRLFGISIWGAFKLLILCILIGSVLMLVEGTQRATEENLANAAADAARQLWAGTVWAVQNFWLPALYGAGVVLPIWTLWRVVSLPFRK